MTWLPRGQTGRIRRGIPTLARGTSSKGAFCGEGVEPDVAAGPAGGSPPRLGVGLARGPRPGRAERRCPKQGRRPVEQAAKRLIRRATSLARRDGAITGSSFYI